MVSAYPLSLLGITVLVALTSEQVFQPSRILMSGPTASSFFVGKSSVVPYFTAVVVDDTTELPSPSCIGVNSTVDWYLAWNPREENWSEVTFTWNGTLKPCATNETNCCTLCVVETFLVTACQSSQAVASLIIQAEIYANSTFTGTVSENKTVIPNQVYQPLGTCPCNLTAGACDIGCCCDQECTSNLKQLFNGFCYTGVFGGNVSPPFDQLCSVQSVNHAPDWFPFLCVQSSLNNSPFLGYFYQGSTISPSPIQFFYIPFQANSQSPARGYKQGDPIFTAQNEYFTIPQSMGGHCIIKAPVAFLQNVDSNCVGPLIAYADITNNTTLQIMNGTGGTLALTVNEHRTGDISSFITLTQQGASPLAKSCVDVALEAIYTFIWDANTLIAVNVNVTLANICLNQSAILTQRFVANFQHVNSSGTSIALSGNPGYQVGKPVLAQNVSAPDGVGTLNLWTTGSGLCSSATPTPVLFGEDSIRGCILNVSFNEDCYQLSTDIMAHLKSFVQVTYVAVRGNSKSTDLSEWVQIIYEEPSNMSRHLGTLKGFCLNIPANMNIQIITADIGAVEGIPQQAILGVKISFSTVTFNCGNVCSGTSFPISASVQFIKVPAQPQPSITSFQLNYTDYDCNRNEVCWPQLAYPLTRYYTGESYSQALAKGMVLVAFFILAAVLGGPWDEIRKAWNNTTL